MIRTFYIPRRNIRANCLGGHNFGFAIYLKACVFIVSFLSLLSFEAHSQSATYFNIRASATVIDVAEIETITLRHMDIDLARAVEGIIHIPAISDPAVGVMLVKGKPNTYARVTFIPIIELENLTGYGVLLFNYEVNGYKQNNQSASEPLDASERMIRFSAQGEYYLWIGGTLDIRNAHPGSYEGEFTLEIEYM